MDASIKSGTFFCREQEIPALKGLSLSKQDEKDLVCDACVFAFDTLLGLIVPGLENNVLKELIIEVCVALDIVSEVECEGAVNNYWVGNKRLICRLEIKCLYPSLCSRLSCTSLTNSPW